MYGTGTHSRLDFVPATEYNHDTCSFQQAFRMKKAQEEREESRWDEQKE